MGMTVKSQSTEICFRGGPENGAHSSRADSLARTETGKAPSFLPLSSPSPFSFFPLSFTRPCHNDKPGEKGGLGKSIGIKHFLVPIVSLNPLPDFANKVLLGPVSLLDCQKPQPQ